MPYLINLTENSERTVIPIMRATLLVGRDDDSDIVLENSSVSRNHASIIYNGQDYFLFDNGSTNGSLVNERPVTAAKLEHMDIICFGTYRFLFDLTGAMAAAEGVRTALEGPRGLEKALISSEGLTRTYDLQQGPPEEVEEIEEGRSMMPLHKPHKTSQPLRIITRGVATRGARTGFASSCFKPKDR